jgi:hypothetical protein
MTENPTEDGFPIEDVNASIRDRDLQRRLDAPQRTTLDTFRRQAIEQGASERAKWIFFHSPEWTWQDLCGIEGWLLYDEETHTQHAFWLTAMN